MASLKLKQRLKCKHEKAVLIQDRSFSSKHPNFKRYHCTDCDWKFWQANRKEDQ